MPLLATAVLAMTMMQAADTQTAPASEPASAEGDQASGPKTGLGTRLTSWLSVLKPRHPAPKIVAKVKRVPRPTDHVRTDTYSKYGWIIKVKTDGFTGAVQCQIEHDTPGLKTRVTYADGALGFRYYRFVEQNDVWFKVDDQPARPWKSTFRDLHAKGLNVAPWGALYNQDTLILIPEDDVMAGRKISIRLNKKRWVETFNVAGLSEALDASKLVGCTPGNYVRGDY